LNKVWRRFEEDEKLRFHSGKDSGLGGKKKRKPVGVWGPNEEWEIGLYHNCRSLIGWQLVPCNALHPPVCRRVLLVCEKVVEGFGAAANYTWARVCIVDTNWWLCGGHDRECGDVSLAI
jgi:hypothetical protein